MGLSRARKVLGAILWLIFIIGVRGSCAQESAEPRPTTVFTRPDTDRFWLSGQINVIFQAHPVFPAAYSGDHSLSPLAEHATSTLLTLYTGLRIGQSTEVIFDVESAGGRGISDALGLAGFTDL